MNIQSFPLSFPMISVPSISPARPDVLGGAGATPAGGFGTALMSAIEGLDNVQKAADGKAMDLAAGGSVDLHDVVLSRETASLHMQLALQTRNKMVEAYQDVMRMQI